MGDTEFQRCFFNNVILSQFRSVGGLFSLFTISLLRIQLAAHTHKCHDKSKNLARFDRQLEAKKTRELIKKKIICLFDDDTIIMKNE